MNNIMIDGLSYFFHKGEYGEYTRTLVDGVASDKKIKISILKDESIISIYKNENLAIKIININRLNEDLNLKPNIFHCFNNGYYIGEATKINIMTVSSIMPILDESVLQKSYLNKWYKKFESSLNKSNKILVSSNYQMTKIRDYYSIKKDKFTVLYPIISDMYTKKNMKLSKLYIQSRFKINSPYLLFCGDLHKRKNLEEVLLFFKHLKETTGIDDKLVIAYFCIHNDACENNYLNELKELAMILCISSDVVFLPNISNIDEFHLLNTAKKFVDLSTSCDFNLSILKAFICDTDIICTDIPLYREYLSLYPSYYNFNEEEIPMLYLEEKSDLEKEKFDYIKDKFKGNESICILKNIYSKL